jgi:hypothetical protein
MAIPVAVHRATILIRQTSAIALLGVGLLATVAWNAFLVYLVIALIKHSI